MLILGRFAMKRTFWPAFLALFFFMSVCVTSFQAEAAVNWQIITTEELKLKIDQNEDLCLINVLPKVIHDTRHIRGSINIPLGKIATSAQLPEKKDTLLVFYCMGVL